MRSTRSLNITLPADVADMIEAKVASGEYATQSDVIRDGLEALADRDTALEQWLLTDVLPVYHDMQIDPEGGVPIKQAHAMLHTHIDTLVAKHKA